MPNYYLNRDGEHHGPYPTEELKRKVASGEIKADELVCAEDSEDWVPAGSLTRPTAPRATMLGHSHSHSAAVSTLSQRPVSLQQVTEARLKMNLPILGMLFSIAIPIALWFAKQDIERSGYSARESTSLLPLAIVVSVFAFVVFFLWFRKAQKHAAVLKASYEHHKG